MEASAEESVGSWTSGPIRVLYIARAPFVSGAERALMSMLRHLDRQRVEPYLVLGCESPLVEQARQLEINVSIVPLAQRSKGSWLLWRRSVKQLKRVIRDFSPDLLHANDVPSCQAMSGLGARLGIPRVVHVRWVINAQEMAWWAYQGAEAVVCISQWVREQLGVPAADSPLKNARIEVIPDCVDWPSIPPEEVSDRDGGTGDRTGAETARDDNGVLTLGFAGQLIESKGLDLVIEALGKVPAERRPRLLIAGEDTQTGGAYQRQLEELARRCGVTEWVSWLGFLNDVAELYRNVDAVVCPSRIEPLGLVPLEAARFNLPTLANRVGGLAETILHDQTGLLVEPTVEAWSHALNQLPASAKLARMGLAAHRRTRELYSPAGYQQRLMHVYHRLIQTN